MLPVASPGELKEEGAAKEGAGYGYFFPLLPGETSARCPPDRKLGECSRELAPPASQKGIKYFAVMN